MSNNAVFDLLQWVAIGFLAWRLDWLRGVVAGRTTDKRKGSGTT